jgi:Ino eighty subunit 2
MDTINKLLKKPAPKRRTRAEIIAQQQADMMATPGAEEGEEERADPLFVRWVSSKEGSRIGVPDEWMEMEGCLGEVLRRGWSGANGSGRMVEEVA